MRGSLFEHVEHDLDRVHEPQPGEVYAFIRAIVTDGNTDLVDLAFDTECVQGLQPIQVACSVREPAVKLE
jgi:hypothetical protein